MNSEFEEQLQSHAFREIPADWQAEILKAAGRPVGTRRESDVTAFFARWFWPYPKAWVGVAAIWVIILALNLAANSGIPQFASANLPPSPAMLTALKEQQAMLARILEPDLPMDAEPATPALPTRSEIRSIRRAV